VHEAIRRTPETWAWTTETRYLHVRVRGRTGPVPGAVAAGLFAVYFFVEGFEPFSVFRLVLGLCTGLAAFRLWRRTTLTASPRGITWHTFLRTVRWRYDAVDHFESAMRPARDGGIATALRVHLSDGRVQWLRGLEGRPGALVVYQVPREKPWALEDLVSQLNSILADLRATAPSSRKAKAS
jgi:hypothetical protein